MKKVACVVLMYLLGAAVVLAAPTTGGSGVDSVSVRIDANGNTADSPNALTSFTVSNPYCYQADPQLDQCAINFRFVQATDNQSSPPYMTWLAVTISGKKRLSMTAFFEGAITYTYDMAPAGMKVPCGAPNAGGAGAQFGYVYGVTLQPLDSSRNPMSTDIANVTCPAFSP
jgi:hypothetical protein